jgi:hypothetical protein
MHSKNEKTPQVHAIVYAKETQVKYIYMLLPNLKKVISRTIVMIHHVMCLLIVVIVIVALVVR